MSKRQREALQPVGWHEWITIPDLCPTPMKAKIDTGARTSSMHAFELTVDGDGDGATAEFEIHPLQRSARSGVAVSCAISGFRHVRSSTGHTELRPVIRTPLQIGGHTYDIDITLTSRDAMGFRVLLGRSAIRHRFVVDAGHSYLQGGRP